MEREQRPELAELLEEGYRLKTEMQALTNRLDDVKQALRDALGDTDGQYQAGRYLLTLQQQERAVTDEAALVERLKEYGLQDAIKTVELPDEAKVVEYLGTGRLPRSVVDAVVTIKTWKRMTFDDAQAPQRRRGG